jgi:predicted flap endonuclease-1-like 5' DNA nuclease
MGYVFSEIWWLLLVALILGFLLGWLALWCRRRMVDGEAARAHAAEIARRDEDLGLFQKRVAQLEGSVSELDGARAKIAELEPQAALVTGLQAKVAALGSNSGDLTAARERIDKMEGELAWQRQAHSAALEEAVTESSGLRARIAELEAKGASAVPAPQAALDIAGGRSLLGSGLTADDLARVEGIGPAIAGLLGSAGITTWQQLADARIDRVQKVLDDAGPSYRVHDPGTWPMQASLLAAGRWADFSRLSEMLMAGREPAGRADGDAETIRGLRARIEELEGAAAPQALDLGAAKEVLGRPIKLDDLTVVEGIGPKIAGLCKEIGVSTWLGLSGTSPERLQQMLDDAGPRYRVHSPGTWPQQARLLAEGKWKEFQALTEQLSAGRE